jgi:hypothetical protein
VNGKWKMENGKWKMENGKWKMENGKWKIKLQAVTAYQQLKGKLDPNLRSQ